MTITSRPSGHVIENSIIIAARPEKVFGYVTDVRREPEWNPQLREAEKLTPGPIGAGTRYRVRFGRGVGTAMIENTAFDPPRSWAAVSTSRRLRVRFWGQVTDAAGGCRLAVRTELFPRGGLRVLSPLLRQVMRRSWDNDLRAIKTITESWPEGEDQVRCAAKTITRVPVPDLCCLWAETGAAPMNIALIAVFDGGPLTSPGGDVRLAAIRSFIAAGLDRAPMLRRTLLPTRPGQGRMAWIDAQRFDIGDHVVLAAPERPFTSDDEFLDWCARRSVIPLDHTRPLWRMDVIPGLAAGRVGVLMVMHHVLADGLRGVATIGALLDTAPGDGRNNPPGWRPEPPPTAVELVTDNLRTRVRAIRRARPGQLPQRLRALRAVSREQARYAPPTLLTGPIGPGRQLLVLRQPLEDLRVWAHAHGCTINDLLLAAVTTGLRDMLAERGACPGGLVLRASVPVGARNGNPGGMIVIPLPAGTADPGQRLQAITAETARRKQHPGEGIAGIVAMPASLARLGVAWARHAAATRINLYVTNVPGPPGCLYLAGARLLEAIPVAPLIADVRLSVTALSYNGALSVALLADPAITNLPTMAAGMRSVLGPTSQQSGTGQSLPAS